MKKLVFVAVCAFATFARGYKRVNNDPPLRAKALKLNAMLSSHPLGHPSPTSACSQQCPAMFVLRAQRSCSQVSTHLGLVLHLCVLMQCKDNDHPTT